MFSITVLATGITGGSLLADIRCEPNMEYSFSYSIVTNNIYETSYSITARGELSKYVTFNQIRFDNLPPNTRQPFTGKINFPSNLTPGWHPIRICVLEDCPSGAMVCGRAGACAVLNFQVLDPEIKPLLSSFSGHNINENQPITFIAKIENIGLPEIKKVTGKVNIFNKENVLLGTSEFDTISIGGGAKGKIKTLFDSTGMPPADYYAKANVWADGIQLYGNTTFKVGSMNVSIKDYTKEIEIGGIKRFLVTAQSNWNDPIPIFSDVRIEGNNASISGRTATVTLSPWNIAETEAYLDMSEFTTGEYNLIITLHYSDKTEIVKDTIKLISSSSTDIETSEIPVVESAKSGTIVIITVLLVIIVVLLTVLNLYLVLKRRDKHEENKKE